MGMVAHILFEAWDRDRPSSQSPFIIDEIIRKRIGFAGLLMTDDIGMEALAGSAGERSAAAIAAGCDLTLHCSGKFDEMLDVAAHVGAMTTEAEGRLARAMAGAMLGASDGPDFAEAVGGPRRAAGARLTARRSCRSSPKPRRMCSSSISRDSKARSTCC